jgi:hypothetical protein
MKVKICSIEISTGERSTVIDMLKFLWREFQKARKGGRRQTKAK